MAFQLTQDQRYGKRVVFLINSFSFLYTMITGGFLTFPAYRHIQTIQTYMKYTLWSIDEVIL